MMTYQSPLMKRFVYSDDASMKCRSSILGVKKYQGFAWSLLVSSIAYGALVSSCGNTKFPDPFERPKPGSWVSPPANLTAEPQARKGKILFLRVKDSISYGRPVSLTVETLSPEGKSQTSVKFEIPNSQLDSKTPACVDVGEKIEEFKQSNPDLLRVCDPAVIEALSNTGPISITYYGGTTRFLTGVSSVRAMIDDYQVVVVQLD